MLTAVSEPSSGMRIRPNVKSGYLLNDPRLLNWVLSDCAFAVAHDDIVSQRGRA
jgi:hypothetical protein